MTGDGRTGIACRVLALGLWLAVCGFVAAAAEDSTPTTPKEVDTPPSAQGAERPKLRRWLDEPAARSAAENAAAEQSGVTLPEDELAKRNAMLVTIQVKLKEAKKAFSAGDYQAAIDIARDMLALDPRNIAAAEMLRKSLGKILDADEIVTGVAGERRDREAILEATQHAVRPPPRLKALRPHLGRRGEEPETGKYRKMAEKLEQPVTVDFMKADLEWVLNTLFILTGVNIIADQAAMEGKTLTLHVEEVPLKEVLNFIVRNNEGIQFSITEDAVWVTASEQADLKKIMYPRVYPIHHGLVSTTEGSGGGGGGGGSSSGRSGRGGSGGGRSGGGRSGGGGGRGGGGAGGGADEPSYLETVLKWLKDAKDPQTFPDGSDYLVDRQSNQLIVYTTASGHDAMARFLDLFDQPPIQVLIKTRFLSIRAKNDKSLGVELTSLKTRLGNTQIGTPEETAASTAAAATADAATAGTAAAVVGRNPFRAFNYVSSAAGQVLTLTGRRTDPLFQATVNALLTSSQTKILSEPQILAINNKAAMIDITTHFSYITDLRPVTTSNFGGNGTVVSDVPSFVPEFDEDVIGFTLEVTPSVGRDLKTINLHLAPVIDSLSEGQDITQFQSFDASVSSNTTGASIKRPMIDQTSLETDVVLEDNGYVIIGGLIRADKTVTERKVPGLHRIPYLGYLFKTKGTTVDKTNMMIIVEAQIITVAGRTYYKDNEADDAEPREGGTNRAPGQTSELLRPASVNSALGLATQELGPPPTPVASSNRRQSEGARSTAPAAAPGDAKQNAEPPRRTRPTAPPPAVAAADDTQNAAQTPERSEARSRMERLAKASRSNAMPVAAATGWAVSEEERGDGGGAPLPNRGEVVAPPND